MAYRNGLFEAHVSVQLTGPVNVFCCRCDGSDSGDSESEEFG